MACTVGQSEIGQFRQVKLFPAHLCWLVWCTVQCRLDLYLCCTLRFCPAGWPKAAAEEAQGGKAAAVRLGRSALAPPQKALDVFPRDDPNDLPGSVVNVFGTKRPAGFYELTSLKDTYVGLDYSSHPLRAGNLGRPGLDAQKKRRSPRTSGQPPGRCVLCLTTIRFPAVASATV